MKKIPVQNWTFENEPVIRIGRSTDNHVVLYSAVVSRHHVELRHKGSQWEIVNLGTNGTYLDGKRITQVTAEDGVVIRLARSGPNIQIRIGPDGLKEVQRSLTEEKTIGQGSDLMSSTALLQDAQEYHAAPPTGMLPVPPHLKLSETESDLDLLITASEPSSCALPEMATASLDTLLTSMQPQNLLEPHLSDEGLPLALRRGSDCPHARAGTRFCLDCGQPLHPRMAIAAYEVLETLGEGEVGVTYWAWREGQSVALKTLNGNWVDHPLARQALQQEATLLQQLDHPRIPRLIDFFQVRGQPYLVMTLIQGQTLHQYVQQQGPVSEVQAANWVIEVCDVLTYLHQRSPPMLHRHLTPDALILSSGLQHPSQVFVVSFGAIKADLFHLARLANSAVYSPPEAQTGDLEPASDLYSLGPILVYLLTGHDPALYYGSREQGVRLYPEYVPGLSPRMTHILRTLTHPHLELRYSNAAALAADLSAIATQSN